MAKSNLRKMLVPFIGFTLLTQAVAWAHECDAILQQGIRNTFEEVRTGDFKNSFKSAYCNKNSTGNSTSSGMEVGASSAKYGLNFGSNDSDTSEARAEYCGSTESALSDEKNLKAMQSIADKNIVDAWSSCKSTNYGVMINGELNGKNLILTYTFRSAGSIAQASVEGDPYIGGAKCDTMVKRGTVINTGGRAQVCIRNGDEPVSVVINTNFQPARFFIPAVAKAKPPAKPEIPTLAEFCKNWKGPGTPTACLGDRNLPGVGVAPEGYSWCVLDGKFNKPPTVQGYCFAKEVSGRCQCAKVPSGMPQPSMEMYGIVYQRMK